MLVAAIVGAVALIVLIITIVGMTRKGPVFKEDIKYVYANQKSNVDVAAIIACVILIFVIIVYLISRNAPFMTDHVVKVKATIEKRKPERVDKSQFSGKFEKRLVGLMGAGETQSSFLNKVFGGTHRYSVETLTEGGVSAGDYCRLVEKYVEMRGVECVDRDDHLEKIAPTPLDTHVKGVVKVKVGNPGISGSLEAAYLKNPFEPLQTFALPGFEFRRIDISDYTVHYDDAGKLVVVCQGDKRACMAVSTVAVRFNDAHCSIAKSGKRIVDLVQSAIKVFSVKDNSPVKFTIVQQIREKKHYFVDVVQAGTLSVAIRSDSEKHISRLTAPPPPDAPDSPKYYRLEAHQGDYVVMYTGVVGYNAYPSVIAASYRAAELAARVSAMFSLASAPVNIPGEPDGGARTPVIPPGCADDILVLSVAIHL
jgi:hypothetical protein